MRGRGYPERLIGAVPNAGIAVVKLKEGKALSAGIFLRAGGNACLSGDGLMMAVSYLNDVANVLNMPLVICLALGNSDGGHGTDGPLSNS